MPGQHISTSAARSQAQRELTILTNQLVGYACLVLTDLESIGNDTDLVEDAHALVSEAKTVQRALHEAAAGWQDSQVLRLEDLANHTAPSLLRITMMTGNLAKVSSKRSVEFVADLARVRVAGDGFRDRVTRPGRTSIRRMSSLALSPTSTLPTVLIVDDQEINARVLQRRLERAGYVASVATSGQEALEALAQMRVDVVLLDVVMPDLSGLDVLAQIKVDVRLRDIPVVMLSANDDSKAMLRCLELGADDYLVKPCDAALLQARLASSLEKKQLRDREKEMTRQLEADRAEIERLLHTILPTSIAAELRASGHVQARRHENVAVLFADVVGFTQWCDRRTPDEVLGHLQELVETQEDITTRFGLEKIKTIGDAFLAVGGLLNLLEDPVLAVVRAGLEMVRVAPTLRAGWQLRVGVHVGPLQAGVVGRNTCFFDVWGDTVNTAARVQAHGQPGAVVVSRLAWENIADCCVGTSLGTVQPKGLPLMELVRVDRA